jgi:hypothetical protein
MDPAPGIGHRSDVFYDLTPILGPVIRQQQNRPFTASIAQNGRHTSGCSASKLDLRPIETTNESARIKF